jgi:hypothetical protein
MGQLLAAVRLLLLVPAGQVAAGGPDHPSIMTCRLRWILISQQQQQQQLCHHQQCHRRYY